VRSPLPSPPWALADQLNPECRSADRLCRRLSARSKTIYLSRRITVRAASAARTTGANRRKYRGLLSLGDDGVCDRVFSANEILEYHLGLE
jgi:hypothetical protein